MLSFYGPAFDCCGQLVNNHPAGNRIVAPRDDPAAEAIIIILITELISAG